ncbi:MAG: hypothetical protein AB7F86_02725 [Bdellovibrionales bacterium]
MSRKFKPRGSNSQLESLRVELIPATPSDKIGPDHESELTMLLVKIIQLGRSRKRPKEEKDMNHAA